jgi:cytochrome c biogenesis protein CcdA
MTEVGLLAAFVAGALALLSPCSALLLPSFFAYAAWSPRALLARTLVFFIGLLLVLVPLGMGAALASRIFYGHRALLITLVGWSLVAFGVLVIVGRGFILPGAHRLAAQAQSRSLEGAGWIGTLLLGASSGIAGFCSGPILGAILTVAASAGSTAYGALLLATYALGMAAPLFVLAVLWDRLRIGERLRPHLTLTSLIAGGAMIVAGLVFLVFDGTAGLLGDEPLVSAQTQESVVATLSSIPPWLWPAAVAAAAAVIAWRRSVSR